VTSVFIHLVPCTVRSAAPATRRALCVCGSCAHCARCSCCPARAVCTACAMAQRTARLHPPTAGTRLPSRYMLWLRSQNPNSFTSPYSCPAEPPPTLAPHAPNTRRPPPGHVDAALAPTHAPFWAAARRAARGRQVRVRCVCACARACARWGCGGAARSRRQAATRTRGRGCARHVVAAAGRGRARVRHSWCCCRCCPTSRGRSGTMSRSSTSARKRSGVTRQLGGMCWPWR
jgi:hypothetical protein